MIGEGDEMFDEPVLVVRQTGFPVEFIGFVRGTGRKLFARQRWACSSHSLFLFM